MKTKIKWMAYMLLFCFLLAGCQEEKGNLDASGKTDIVSDSGADVSDKTVSEVECEITSKPEKNPKKVDVCLAEPLDSLELRFSGAYFMDFACYVDERFEVDKPKDRDEYFYCKMDCLDTDFPVIQAYVQLLCEEYEFELVGEPYYLEQNKRYEEHINFDYVLRYIGDAHTSKAALKGRYSENMGDLIIRGVSEWMDDNDDGTWDMECCIEYADWLVTVDEGYRYGTDEKLEEYAGESVGAGVSRLNDGTYQTTDGRFSVSLGQAMIYTDGNAKTYPAWYEWDKKLGIKRLRVDDKFGITQMTFNLPLTKKVTTGDMFTHHEVGTQYYLETSDRVPSHDTTFAYLHGDEYYIPLIGMNGEISRFNARVMYWDEEAAVAVFYFYVQFCNAPKEVECVAAVSLMAGVDATNPGEADYYMKVRDSLEITGPSEFGAGYNLWTWEYVSGSNLSELHGTVGRTCELIAHKAGTVHLKVTYEYSVKEPDVLTGNMGNVAKSKTQEYVIVITE